MIRNVITMILTGTYEEMEELESLKIATNESTAAHGRYMYYYRYVYRHGHIVVVEKKKQKECTTGQKRIEIDETNGNDKKKRKANSENGKKRTSNKEDRGRQNKKRRKVHIIIHVCTVCYNIVMIEYLFYTHTHTHTQHTLGSIITVTLPPTISASPSPRSPSDFESASKSPASASLLSIPSSPSLLSMASLSPCTSPPLLPPPVFEEISVSSEQLPSSSQQMIFPSSPSESPSSVLSAIKDLRKQVDTIESNQYTILNYLHYLQYNQNFNFNPAFGAPPSIPAVPTFQMPVSQPPMQSTELSTVSTTVTVSTASTVSTTSSPLLINANGKNLLPSSQIERAKLLSAESVLEKYHNLRNESKAPTLAWKLAREAIFGDSVLRHAHL